MKPVAHQTTFVPVDDAQSRLAQVFGGRVMRTAVGAVFAGSVALGASDSAPHVNRDQPPNFPLAAEKISGVQPPVVVRQPLRLDVLQDVRLAPEPLIQRASLVTSSKAPQGFVSLTSIGGIPRTAVDAYQRAADFLARVRSQCGLDWSVLAGIGQVESNHGRYGGARLFADGTTRPVIRGIPLDGRPGVATISDSDGGRFDDDPVFDRAVGPMQFIPSTWRRYAADGNADGAADPDNIYDATLAAGRYLCASGRDTRDPAQLAQAIFTYNHSDQYVRVVIANAAAYRGGSVPVLTNPVSSASSPSRPPKQSSTQDKPVTAAASAASADVRPLPPPRPAPASSPAATATPPVPAKPVAPATPALPATPLVPTMPLAPATSLVPIEFVIPQPPRWPTSSWPLRPGPGPVMPILACVPTNASDAVPASPGAKPVRCVIRLSPRVEGD